MKRKKVAILGAGMSLLVVSAAGVIFTQRYIENEQGNNLGFTPKTSLLSESESLSSNKSSNTEQNKMSSSGIENDSSQVITDHIEPRDPQNDQVDILPDNSKALDEQLKDEGFNISGMTTQEKYEKVVPTSYPFSFETFNGNTYTDPTSSASTVYLGNKNDSEYNLRDSRTLWDKLMNQIGDMDYTSISDELTDLSSKHRFMLGLNRFIAQISDDMEVIYQLNNAQTNAPDVYLRSLQSPVVLAMATFQLPENMRRDTIYDKDSISPVHEGSLKFVSISTVNSDANDPVVKKILATQAFNKSQALFKIGLNIDDQNYSAYVPFDNPYHPTLFGLYPDNPKNNFEKSVNYWNRVDDHLDGK